jgi:hypothetical protein
MKRSGQKVFLRRHRHGEFFCATMRFVFVLQTIEATSGCAGGSYFLEKIS